MDGKKQISEVTDGMGVGVEILKSSNNTALKNKKDIGPDDSVILPNNSVKSSSEIVDAADASVVLDEVRNSQYVASGVMREVVYELKNNNKFKDDWLYAHSKAKSPSEEDRKIVSDDGFVSRVVKEVTR